MYNEKTDVLGPLDLAYEALEKGLVDEALLHLGKARMRARGVMISSNQLIAPERDGSIIFPLTVNRFEVIDHGREELLAAL